jgi:DNA-binding HxlR family transcriptional regulator
MRSGFGQFCPVAVASEVFAGRWTPILLRELLAGSQLFNEIHRGMPLISRALLARRLRELEGAGVITREALAKGRGHRYRLTAAGEEFRPVIESLAAWGQRWATRVDRRNLDPGLLMWNLRRRVALERLPPRRVVARFRFRGVAAAYRGPRTFWLILERPQADLCVTDPGFEVDLDIDADLKAMASAWLGDVPLERVLRAKEVELLGPSALVKAFPTWWLLSPYAGVPRPAAGQQPGAAPVGSRLRPGATR